MKHPKFIFVIGGVMSSVGKGITASSIGTILQSRGYRITNVKCDMYVNIDAGTIRPTEHGEVFIGGDGGHNAANNKDKFRMFHFNGARD